MKIKSIQMMNRLQAIFKHACMYLEHSSVVETLLNQRSGMHKCTLVCCLEFLDTYLLSRHSFPFDCDGE
jgi:hypothetical protein